MITINDINRFNNTLSVYALSTDELPTDYIEFNRVKYKVTNASTVLFMDTGALKIFDEENKVWKNM